MDEALLQRLEGNFDLLAPRGEELVDRFYANLFARYSDLRPLFADDNSSQTKKLLASLVLVVRNLRNPADFEQALTDLGARHSGYGAREAHYPAVRDTLVDVMGQMAGDAWSEQLTGDWTAALDLVASVMIEGQRAAAVSQVTVRNPAPHNPAPSLSRGIHPARCSGWAPVASPRTVKSFT